MYQNTVYIWISWLTINADISRTQEVCHVIDIIFGSSFGKYNCAKFYHCKICVTDFREGGFLPLPTPYP